MFKKYVAIDSLIFFDCFALAAINSEHTTEPEIQDENTSCSQNTSLLQPSLEAKGA